jgi:hypothetical protein
MSRTRLTDQRTGYVADRVIVRLTKDDILLVFDIAKVLRPNTTPSPHFGTAQAARQDRIICLTRSTHRQIHSSANARLLIQFLQSGVRTDGTFPIKPMAG